MSDYLPWREAEKARRRSRAGIRHDDGPIPDEWAARVTAERLAVWRALWPILTAVTLIALTVTMAVPAAMTPGWPA